MRAAIIGGGLAGLACARELVDAGVDVVVLEAGDRFGGQLRTTRERGFLVEEGADGFDPTSPLLQDLLRDLRLHEDLVRPEGLPTLVLERTNGRRTLTAGLLTGHETAVPALTLRGGMGALTRAFTRRLEPRADLRVGNAAVAIARTGDGWTIFAEAGPALPIDALVLALPPRAAAWLVHPVDPAPARALAALGTRSLIVVSLAYQRRHVTHPLDAAGIVVPRTLADEGLEVCTFVSSTFTARAPCDTVLLRAVLRPARGQLATTTDDGWGARAHAMLQPLLGISETPDLAWVARWADAIPMVDDAYRERVAEARALLCRLGRVELAGAAFDEPGIEGALRSGRDAARRLCAG